MKKILRTMLKAEGNFSDQNKDGVQTAKKKGVFCKGPLKYIGKYFYKKTDDKSTNINVKNEDFKDDNAADSESKPEEVTVELIQKHIVERRLLKASKDLIILENKIYSNTDEELHEIKNKELEFLYDELNTKVFRVVKESILENDESLLKEAVQAITEQEKEDKNVSENNSMPSSPVRPRKWMQKWHDSVSESVEERMGNLPGISPNDSGSSFSRTFAILGKTIKTDLTHVVKNLKPHYPTAEFDVCNIYAKCYHKFLKTHIENITEFELTGKDSHFILSLVLNIYPNNILGDPVLTDHIQATKLERLLTLRKIRELKSIYIPYEVESVREWMVRSLNLEVERWKEGLEPLKLGDCYHSELHIDVIQSFHGGIQRAAEITEQMSNNMIPLLSNELVEFLKSYKKAFEEYRKNKNDEYFKPIVMANINCCQSFREFVAQSDAKLDLKSKEAIKSILTDFEKVGFETLLQDLYDELKGVFKRISQGNGMCSYQTMQDIIQITDKHISHFGMLTKHCYKETIGKVHLHLVKEYITRLLKKKVTHKNVQQLQTLAKQIRETAMLIKDFFSVYESQAFWLENIISKVADIIRLQDIGAIQLEVATLAAEYPDIGRKQVEAILYIKGNLSKSEVRSIVGIIDSQEKNTSTTQPFFSLIKPS
ncbi:tumor necrosis factor alpha-induced protein 2-like [Pelobates fuscus]|uniref:tumor necrosis factor alpha-induced protein 2-like n=1 Tax=Pelobates fuscus TaxID=191477 RepID=UPI002FE4AA93